jgi:hypothetical protein
MRVVFDQRGGRLLRRDDEKRVVVALEINDAPNFASAAEIRRQDHKTDAAGPLAGIYPPPISGALTGTAADFWRALATDSNL